MPAFREIVVRPVGGQPTRIVRTANGAHVDGLTVDDTTSSRSWLTLGRPHTIVVATTNEADPTWGTAPGDAPPSYPSR